ncbi:MAG: hypothetical protein ACMZ7B_05675 [Balneola sp.]
MKNVRRLILNLVMVIIATPVFAQEAIKFSSTFTVTQESDFKRLNEVRKIFDSEMIKSGAEYSETEGVMFLVGLSEENEDGYTALSVTSLYRLPENIIQAGKYGQVFYSAIQTEGIQQLTQEGNEIRDKMSEDYLRQFYSIGTNKTIIVEKKNLRQEIRRYIANFSF